MATNVLPSRIPQQPPEPAHSLTDEILALVEGRIAQPFDGLAARALARQLRHYPTYGNLAASRGVQPDALERGDMPWTQVPPMPASAFAHLPLHIGEPAAVFRSSGTTRDGAPRSTHHHSEPELYRRIIDRSLPPAVFGEEDPAPRSRTIVSLIPPISLVADSSLGFMVDHAMTRWGDEQSIYAFDENRLQPTNAVRWMRSLAGEGRSPIMLTTALALWAVLDEVERSGRREPWPRTLRIMETGGFKTERFRLTRGDLLCRLRELTGVGDQQVVREYGMTELSSQAYSDPGVDPDVFALPAWARVRALDPETLGDVEPGEPGLLAFLDLGNVGSAAYVLTEDLGRLAENEPAVGRRFELLGRARDAQLRGCSLTTEQLLP